MAARRDKIPPYEIMGPRGRLAGRGARHDSEAGGEGADGPEPSGWRISWVTDRSESGEGAASGPAAWWAWSGAGVPIILRVPRGVAIAAAVGLLGLLVLAYWVGYERGDAAAAQRVRAEYTGSGPAPDAPPAPNRGAAGGPTGAPEPNPAGGTTAAPDTADPRQAGLNYFVVASYPRDHAERCARFLASRGVETVIGSANNDGLHAVWVVERGFTADQYGGAAYTEFKRRLRELGRAWRRFNDGQGDAFETMTTYKY